MPEISQPLPTVETMALRVIMDVANSEPPIYANFAELAAGPFEIEILFGRVPAKLTDAQLAMARNNEPLPIAPIARIAMPHSVATMLLNALRQQVDLLEAQRQK